ncbi:MAG: SUMF1/EgtB/PvdO family nonheme iron enzyme [Leptolinea sp.]
MNCLPGWEEGERNILPVKVILRHFWRWLENQHITQPSECTLFDYIKYDLDSCKLEEAVDLLAERLEEGKAMLLLDGLDEIPTGAARRLILDAVTLFTNRYKTCRFLVTCRVLSYQKAAWKLPAYDFPELTLAKFNPQQIEDFIHAWYREVAQKWEKSEADVASLQVALKREIRRSYLKNLSPIPLLLTIMALVNTVYGALPGTKALLYKRCVDILLWEWEQKRFSEVGHLPRLSELLQQAGRVQSDLLVCLAKLAYQAHTSWRDKNRESLAEISVKDLQWTLCELHPQKSLTWTEEMLDCIRERAGLLLDQGEDTFTFPHRSFQEYLAGVHLARQRNFVSESLKLLEQGDYWRETVLYAVGCLVNNNQQYEPPAYLVEKLCPERGEDTERAWQNIWMAGRVVLEMGANRLQDEADGKNLLERLRSRLAELLEQAALTSVERAAAGDVLSVLGDPRFDAACFHLPLTYRAKAEPFFGLLEIPSGKFTMGSREGDKGAYDSEYGNPGQLIMPYRYWMGRYPVSVVQYSRFIKCGGYDNDAWWSEIAWSWRNGNWDSQVEDEKLKNFLARRPTELRYQPIGWQEQQVYANHPVVGVSWFEARAYCQWLDSRLRQKLAESNRPPLPDDYEIRLPTEAEWEKAARHADDRRYPWGDADCDNTRANYADSQIDSASSVGMFPHGATPDGLTDLSGNVWEWTLTPYAGYPYKPYGQGDAAETVRRTVRGGSWLNDSWDVRCASRLRLVPVNVNSDIGFRYVLSLSSSVF